MPNLIGTAPDQVPVNGFLGNMAFQNKEGVITDLLSTTALTVTGTIANSLGSAAAPSYTFIGDTNTGIFSPAADTLAFSEGGVEAMRIDSSGNVGISNTTPRALLHVGTSASLTDIPVPAGNFAIVRGGGYNGATTAGIQLSGGYGDAGRVAAWQIKSVGSGSGSNFVNDLLFTTQNGFSGSENERMRITSAGNVGIGITNPQQLLALGNSTDQVGAGVSGAVSTVYFGSPTNIVGGQRRISYDRASGNLNFIDGSIASPTTQMTMTSAGNVGIGTSSPSEKLSLNSAGSVQVATKYINGNTTGVSVGAASDGSAFVYQAAALPFIVYTNAVERMRIDNSGNLLVGTAAAGTSAAKVIGMANATAPTTSPAGMGQLYVEGGALKFRGSSGTVTTIAPA